MAEQLAFAAKLASGGYTTTFPTGETDTQHRFELEQLSSDSLAFIESDGTTLRPVQASSLRVTVELTLDGQDYNGFFINAASPGNFYTVRIYNENQPIEPQ